LLPYAKKDIMIRQYIKKSLINSVKFYQKFISPYKGFHCAHSHHIGSISCSHYGLKVLNEQHGVYESLRLIQHRLKSCAHINQLYHNPKKTLSPMQKKQGGFVDGCDGAACDGASCDGCDMPDCGSMAPDCNALTPDCSLGSHEACSCASSAAEQSASSNFWEVLYFADACGSCDPFYRANPTTTPIPDETSHKQNSLILPNFQLIEHLENDYILYK
jgi:putative component of membrane protein insertase Oxa1/YidC/SpoIIIJ protein YidD